MLISLEPHPAKHRLLEKYADRPPRAWRYAVTLKTVHSTFLALAAGFAAVMLAGTVAGFDTASANQCANQCYAQENACRRATSDDPKCSAELTKCLQSCRGK